MDRGAWRATIQGATENRTRLKCLSKHACIVSAELGDYSQATCVCPSGSQEASLHFCHYCPPPHKGTHRPYFQHFGWFGTLLSRSTQ